jgi:hypothetical protein
VDDLVRAGAGAVALDDVPEVDRGHDLFVPFSVLQSLVISRCPRGP